MQRIATLDIIKNVISMDKILGVDNDDLTPEDLIYKEHLEVMVEDLKEYLKNSEYLSFDECCSILQQEFIEELRKREIN
jgi:uncharacterized protein YehS (DUF1456 family)